MPAVTFWFTRNAIALDAFIWFISTYGRGLNASRHHLILCAFSSCLHVTITDAVGATNQKGATCTILCECSHNVWWKLCCSRAACQNSRAWCFQREAIANSPDRNWHSPVLQPKTTQLIIGAQYTQQSIIDCASIRRLCQKMAKWRGRKTTQQHSFTACPDKSYKRFHFRATRLWCNLFFLTLGYETQKKDDKLVIDLLHWWNLSITILIWSKATKYQIF